MFKQALVASFAVALFPSTGFSQKEPTTFSRSLNLAFTETSEWSGPGGTCDVETRVDVNVIDEVADGAVTERNVSGTVFQFAPCDEDNAQVNWFGVLAPTEPTSLTWNELSGSLTAQPQLQFQDAAPRTVDLQLDWTAVGTTSKVKTKDPKITITASEVTATGTIDNVGRPAFPAFLLGDGQASLAVPK